MTVTSSAEDCHSAISPNGKESDAPCTTLAEIYRTYHAFVWRNARRLSSDTSAIDDVVHEVFLVVARRLHEFRGEAHIRSWLFAITYHVIQRLRRDRSRYQKRLDEYGQYQAIDDPSIESSEEGASYQLRQLLQMLSEPKRLVFIMAELEGMTSVEIAQCLGTRPGTVDSRLRGARLELQALLEREEARTRRFSR